MNKNIKMYNDIKNYIPYDEKEKVDKQVMLDFMEKNEDVLLRNNKIAHFTVSALVLNKEKTKVLMIFHNIYKSWAWIGGHADGDDNLLNVIKKEIQEETGLSNYELLYDGIYGLNIITVDAHIKRGQQVNSHLHFDVEYIFEANELDNIRIKEDENSNIGWIDIDKVNEYSSEEKMKPIYKRLFEKLNNIL